MQAEWDKITLHLRCLFRPLTDMTYKQNHLFLISFLRAENTRSFGMTLGLWLMYSVHNDIEMDRLSFELISNFQVFHFDYILFSLQDHRHNVFIYMYISLYIISNGTNWVCFSFQTEFQVAFLKIGVIYNDWDQKLR